MIILDTLLIGGLKFVLGKIVAAVDAEMDDDSRLREELLAAQMRLELGEITEVEYVEIEKALLERINEIRMQRTGGAAAAGTFKVTGVEATFADEATFAGEETAEGEQAPSRPRRGRR
jgi:gas vesicle protein GvpG